MGLRAARTRLWVERQAAHGAEGALQRGAQRGLFARHVQEADGVFVATRREQRAVVAERQRAHRQREARGDRLQLARRVGEQPHLAVLAAGGEAVAGARRSERSHACVVVPNAAGLARRGQRVGRAQVRHAVRAAGQEVLVRAVGAGDVHQRTFAAHVSKQERLRLGKPRLAHGARAGQTARARGAGRGAGCAALYG